MQFLISILFGIVEGITEWLPVSSTGHMILLDELVKFDMSDKFKEMYLIVIQLGAILAVIIIYFWQLWPFSSKKEDHYIKKDIWTMWFKVLVSCIPAVIIELLLGDKLEEMFYNYKVVAIMLILFGILFIVIETVFKKNNKESKINSIAEITYKAAFIIGMFQCIAAVFPGTSRSGATIIGGLIIGMSRAVAAEYTFFLAVPVMLGASLMKIVDFGFNFSTNEILVLLTGMIVAFAVSMVIIKGFMSYIKKHDFKVFGWYRIVLGIIVLIFFSIR